MREDLHLSGAEQELIAALEKIEKLEQQIMELVGERDWIEEELLGRDGQIGDLEEEIRLNNEAFAEERDNLRDALENVRADMEDLPNFFVGSLVDLAGAIAAYITDVLED